jgi:hypothetical protein
LNIAGELWFKRRRTVPNYNYLKNMTFISFGPGRLYGFATMLFDSITAFAP